MPDRTTPAPLEAHCFPIFRQRPPWLGGDLQTVRNTLLGSLGRRIDLPACDERQLRLPADDGTGDVLVARLNQPTHGHGGPVVVLVHGLTGCEDSLYVRASAAHLLAQGYRVLRLNLRGAGPSRPLCRAQYHAGRSEDLRIVLRQLDPTLTADGVVLVGYSLGGNVVLKYLGEEGASVPVTAAASISAPIDMAATAVQMMRRRNAAYHGWLLRRMKSESLAPAAEVSPEERRAASRARTVYQFDDSFVAPRNGFGTADRYYALSSGEQFLPAIRIPTLVIHAGDDPWIPMAPYRRVDWRANGHLVPLLPSRGGHVGFHGAGRSIPWHDACLAMFVGRVCGGRAGADTAA